MTNIAVPRLQGDGTNRISGEYATAPTDRPNDEVAILRLGTVTVYVTFGDQDGVPLIMVDTEAEPAADGSTVRISLNDADLFPEGPR